MALVNPQPSSSSSSFPSTSDYPTIKSKAATFFFAVAATATTAAALARVWNSSNEAAWVFTF